MSQHSNDDSSNIPNNIKEGDKNMETNNSNSLNVNAEPLQKIDMRYSYSFKNDRNVFNFENILFSDNRQSLYRHSCIDLIYKITQKLNDKILAIEDFRVLSMTFIDEFMEDKDSELKMMDTIINQLKNNELKILHEITKETYFYKLIKSILAENNYLKIFKLRIILNELDRKFNSLIKKDRKGKIIVYRNQVLRIKELNKLKESLNTPFFFPGFIATSLDEKIANKFVKTLDSDHINVILVIRLKEEDNENFIDLTQISHYNELEILIKMNNFFICTGIENIDRNEPKIHLEIYDSKLVEKIKNQEFPYINNFINELLKRPYNLSIFCLIEFSIVSNIDFGFEEYLNKIDTSENDCNYSIIQNFSGLFNYKKGDYFTSLIKFKNALKNLKPTDQLSILINIACSLEKIGFFDLSKEIFKLVISYVADYNHLDFEQLQKTIYNNIGCLSIKQKKLNEALKLLDPGFNLNLKNPGENFCINSILLNNISNIYFVNEDIDKADTCIEKSIPLNKMIFDYNLYSDAISLNDLGFFQTNKSQYNDAISKFKEAIDLCKKTLGENHPDTSIIYKNLGSLYWKTGNNTEAVNKFNVELNIRIYTLGENDLTTI